MNEARRSRIWSWAFIAIGVACVVIAPILYVTGLSRATGVVLAIVGIVAVLLGLAIPHVSPRLRAWVIMAFLAVLIILAITGIWSFIVFYLLQESSG